MLHLAARLLDVPAGEVYLDYFGLNHLGWVRRVLHRGEDYLPTFLSMIRAAGGFPGLPFEPDLLLELGLLPNEYLKYYYSTRQTVDALRAAPQSRAEFLSELNEAVRRDLADLLARGESQTASERYLAYLQRRGETYLEGPGEPTGLPAGMRAGDGGGYADVALDVIEALSGGGQRVLIVNAPNQGAVEGMAPEDVVEVPVLVRADGLQPMAVGPIPGHALGLMLRLKAYERMTIEAAAEGSRSKALLALTLHPLVADTARARSMLQEMEHVHAATFPRLQ
jgi:6-phospho-beta-glucosidase